MGLSDVWNRTLVYFGIAEDEDWDEDALATQEEVEREYRSRSSRQNVRRLPRSREPSEWTESDSSTDVAPPPPSTSQRRSRLRGVDSSQVRVHLVLPRSFNDAQQIGSRTRSR